MNPTTFSKMHVPNTVFLDTVPSLPVKVIINHDVGIELAWSLAIAATM
jgi:hypothetical protein